MRIRGVILLYYARYGFVYFVNATVPACCLRSVRLALLYFIIPRLVKTG